ncbi:MAG TPA: efflux RND transporter periplasmic adaptor subunit [Rhizomicrobium sp.]|jgi:RND family efflux transporter MFP subunit|nr:efflux RND transporter periplasmic adaptor subunit [Rhizomicrobium sp.]
MVVDPRDALQALKIDREQSERHAEGAPRSRHGRWIAGAIFLVLVVVGCVAAGWWLLRPRPALVRTVIAAAEGNAASGSVLNASGYVVAEQEATVAAQITGMVTAVRVNEGDRVAADQILARLDDSAARATLESADSQLEADRALIPQYAAQLDRDQRMLVRSQRLARQEALSQSALESAEAAVAVDQSLLAHARGQVAVDEKTAALDRTLLSYTVIRAPFAGVVTERYAHPGEMISPQAVGGFTQTGICKIVDMHSLEIDVDVNEAYIQRVHDGQGVEATLDAYPGWTIAAHVISIVPTANEQKATVKVRIAFDRLDPRILPQMGVQVNFVSAGGPAGPALMRIPAAALQQNASRMFVYIAENGRAVRRAVTARRIKGGDPVVTAGLDGGEHVIVSASAVLKDGMEIREP